MKHACLPARQGTKIMKIILFSFLVFTFIAFLVLNYAEPIKIEGDGVFYYSWLHSAVFDHDFDFKNQLEHFAAYDLGSGLNLKYRLTPTGKIPNPYAFGSAIMWLPFFAIAHLLSLFFQFFNLPAILRIAMQAGADFFKPDGYSYFYVFLINFSGLVYGWFSVFLIWKILKKIFSPENKFAILATVSSIWLATPLVYYQFFEPFMAHSASLFLVCAWLYLLVKIYKKEKVNSWLLALVIFLMLAARWQNAIFLVCYLPIIFSSSNLPPTPSFVRRGRIKDFLFFIFPIAVFVLIQSLIWKNLYGSYFLTPQGVGFIKPQIHLLYTLFSTNRGLLLWSPILILALAGLPWLWQKSKFWFFIVLAMFFGQWILNSSLNDLGGGDAFGARRFIEALPFLALPLFCFLEKFKKSWLVFLLAGIFIFWNLFLMTNYVLGKIPHAGEFNFLRILTK